MALVLDQNKEVTEKDSKSAALLNKYVSTAVKMTHSDTILQAHKTTHDFAKRQAWEEINPKDIDAKRAEIKEELKEFGFRDKAAYYANIKAGDHSLETLLKLGAAAATVVVANAVSPELGQAAGIAAIAYCGSKVLAAGIGRPETPKQLFSTRDYTDLKHADMALRKLSHRLEKKELDNMKREAMMKGVYFPISGRGMGY